MAADKVNKVNVVNQAPTGFVLFLAWVGSLVYFVQQADGFWEVVLAFLKSIVWPAYLVHRAFDILNI